MEAFIGLFVLVLAMSLVLALGSKLWFLIRWHLMGWRPAILDKALVDQCVEECSQSALDNAVRDAEEEHGYTMTEADKQSFRKTVAENFRKVIEIYIKRFSMPGGQSS
jgi:hypothetical protein